MPASTERSTRREPWRMPMWVTSCRQNRRSQASKVLADAAWNPFERNQARNAAQCQRPSTFFTTLRASTRSAGKPEAWRS